MRRLFKVLNVPAPLWLVVGVFALTANAQPYFRNIFANGGTLASSSRLSLPQVSGQAANPTLNWGDGDTGWWEDSDDTLRIGVGGSPQFAWNSNYYGSVTNGGGKIYKLQSTAAAAGLTFTADENTGLFQQAAGNVGVTCDGTECARFEHPADLAATETSLFIYDLDNASLDQVTVGATDSGGAGFKVLRIPN